MRPAIPGWRTSRKRGKNRRGNPPNAEAGMKAGIVVFPGINRERDMAITLERSGATPCLIAPTASAS